MELLSNYPALKKHLDWLLGGSRWGWQETALSFQIRWGPH